MTEQQQPLPTPPQEPTAPMPTTPAPAPAPTPAPVQEAASGARFAVYDTTYLKFVGGVYDTRKGATDEAKRRDLKRGGFEIREV